MKQNLRKAFAVLLALCLLLGDAAFAQYGPAPLGDSVPLAVAKASPVVKTENEESILSYYFFLTRVVDYKYVTTGYRTIEDALDAAKDGDSIVMGANAEKDIIVSKHITLDGAGVYSTRNIEVAAEKALNIKNLTVNGTVTGAGSVTISYPVPQNDALVRGDVRAIVPEPTTAPGEPQSPEKSRLFVDGAATNHAQYGDPPNEYVYVGIAAQDDIDGGGVSYASEGNIVTYEDREYVKFGSSVDLTATPDAGYRFKGWTWSPDVAPEGLTDTNPASYKAVRGYALGAIFDVPVARIALEEAENGVPLKIGSSYTPKVPAFEPTDPAPSNTAVTWMSSDLSVAAVDAATGVVTGKKLGVATITATAADGGGASAGYQVRVIPTAAFGAKGYTLYGEHPDGGTQTVAYSVSPAETQGVTLESAGGKFTVDGNKIVAAAIGEDLLNLKYGSDLLVSIPVSVKERVGVRGIQFDTPEKTIYVGDTFDLKSIMKTDPESGYTDTLAYRITNISNKAEAKVNAAGIVTAGAKAGNAGVYVRACNGEMATPIERYVGLIIAERQSLPDSADFRQPLYGLAVNEEKDMSAQLAIPEGIAGSDYSFTAAPQNLVTINGNTLIANDPGTVTVTAKFVLTLGEKSKDYTAKTVLYVDRVDPESVTIDQGDGGILFAGDKLQLSAAAKKDGFSPDQVKQGVTWSVTGDSATVDANGMVTAVAAGTATITATAMNGSAAAGSYALSVYAKPTKLSFAGGESVVRAQDAAVTYEATADGSGVPIEYASSSPAVTVSEAGYTAAAAGEAIVTAKTRRTATGCQLVASQKVKVVERVASITFTNAPTSLAVGESEQLTWTTVPAKPATLRLKFISSDPSALAVDASGKVTALKKSAGPITITVTATTEDDRNPNDPARATVTIATTSTLTDVVLPSAISLKPGEKKALTPVLYPVDAAYDGIAFSKLSGGSAKIGVDSGSGAVTVAADAAVGETATIRATVTVGAGESKTADCAVRVIAADVRVPVSTSLEKSGDAATAKFAKGAAVPTATLLVPLGGGPIDYDVKLNFEGTLPTDAYEKIALSGAAGGVLDTPFMKATLAADGKRITVEAKKPGAAVLELFYADGYVRAIYLVKLVNPIKDIELAAIGDMNIGDSAALNLSYIQADNKFALTESGITESDAAVTFDPEGVLRYDAASRRVRAIGAGETTVTLRVKISTDDYPSKAPFEAHADVKVTALPVESVNLTTGTLALIKGGDGATVAPVIAPVGTGETVTGSAADAGIITLTDEGDGGFEIAPVTTGVTTVTFEAGGKKAELTVAVLPESKQVRLYPAGTLDWTKAVAGKNTNAQAASIKYQSDDETVAAVSSLGVITAKAEGTATITATFGGGVSSCAVRVSEQHVKAAGISLDKTSLNFYIEDGVGRETLTATVTPVEAANKTVTWESSDPRVATVDERTGVVESVALGSATVTARTEDGGLTARCNVTVQSRLVPPAPDPTGLLLRGSLIIGRKQSVTLSGILPINFTGGASWVSADPGVASIVTTKKGTVQLKGGKKDGETKLSVTLSDGRTQTIPVRVVIKKLAVSSVSGPARLSLNVNQQRTLNCRVKPAKASDRTLKWYSTDKKIVTVSETGEATGVAAGTARVIAVSSSGKIKAVEVTVKEAGVTKLTLNKKKATLYANEKLQLTASVRPAEAINKTIVWTSSKPAVATVDPATGLVTAVGKGKATIVATAANGKKAKCVISVKAAPPAREVLSPDT